VTDGLYRGIAPTADATIGRVNYELYMGAALAEARAAAAAGETADGAVAVMDEAMVARGRSTVATTGDPTAHAVITVVREAARRLGRSDLSGLIVFAAVEPCAMCVGALLECEVDGLVYAMPDARSGAVGSVDRGRLSVVAGIMQREAAELRVAAVGARRG
jgi:tRNA(Arg) A34 adenosine deaminase TadA